MSAPIRRDLIAAIDAELAAVPRVRMALDCRDSQLGFPFHVGLRAIEHICKSFHRDLPPLLGTKPEYRPAR